MYQELSTGEVISSSCPQRQPSKMHLQNLIPAYSTIDRLPLVAFGKSPVAVAVPRPVQFRNALFQTLNKPGDRAHAVLRVLRAALERRQGNDPIVHDNPNLFSRGEGGICTRQYCSREGVKIGVHQGMVRENSRWN